MENETKKKHPINIVIIVAVVVILGFFISIASSDEEPKKEEVTKGEVKETPTPEPEKTKELEVTKKPKNAKQTKKPKATKKPKKEDYNIERGEIIGKSDKDYNDLAMTFFSSVPNDKAGNFRLTEFARQVDFNEYVLSYAENNIKDGEIHYIVNFTNKAVAVIHDVYVAWDVLYTEYEKREELDASKIGGGMPLGQYWIYKDNGDIEKIG